MADLTGMDGPAEGDHAVDDFAEKTLDALDLAGRIETGHERAYKALGGHSSETTAFIHNQGRLSETGGGDGGADSGGAAADDKDLGLPGGNDLSRNASGRTAGKGCRGDETCCGRRSGAFDKAPSIHWYD